MHTVRSMGCKSCWYLTVTEFNEMMAFPSKESSHLGQGSTQAWTLSYVRIMHYDSACVVACLVSCVLLLSLLNFSSLLMFLSLWPLWHTVTVTVTVTHFVTFKSLSSLESVQSRADSDSMISMTITVTVIVTSTGTLTITVTVTVTVTVTMTVTVTVTVTSQSWAIMCE
jgi:hypothetical protein